ncbi:MAG: hypothetical protein A2186_01835 [Candidatus Levybacteria bacterium RIFOXYA1_FULL_41_10]|uniref:Uncharacterized protein n=1 Tax=Candidatus Gottesmanbacteria bacterium GW2011_GWB1_44_11c TaxID=1618447 RepID=A0A0G1JQH1_9BACT|nr:MAG: hypothetical protein UT44_C0013G0012 [Candidatus Levybacteria bacterium GW2011_GWA1_39_32]KKR95179.1 MAG: hypothetical protein UU45_C0004G0082 [Candidatus Levybacteria bacterium GW2011_GWA2_41_15]KKT37719.1 MAG: hypothetical protein UW22_C0019G0010 [Candidatus Gottesmanbacteria bacterium GW2011_GWB1_44_11c]OGH21200.1 MAG: hypothetical protein A2695_03645 [Candidatus Levybacteria bacterium RIFCSPHIGHO2_01_FULL_40_83]OGH25935.1 MAG: hypothetical protein A3D82_03220 [Candidatus Levybacteri
MKKLIAGATIVSAYLLPFTKVFAGEPIDLCLEGGGFGGLCGLNFGGPLVGSLLTLAFVGATIIALLFLIYGGIRWIASGGDKTQVEGAREAITGALIGLVIVFLSYFIINILLTFFTGEGLSSLTLPTIPSAVIDKTD